jgi:hypothetical protein
MIIVSMGERAINNTYIDRCIWRGVFGAPLSKTSRKALWGTRVSPCVNRRQIGTPYRHPKGTPLSGGFCGSARAVGAGRGCGNGASAGGDLIVCAAFEAPAVVAGLIHPPFRH